MANKITIEHNSAEVRATLQRLHNAVGAAGMSGAMKEIGEGLVLTTRQRFVTSTAPDGTRWAPNAESTYLRLLGKSSLRKDGRINARGTAAVTGKQPLVASGMLADTIAWQLIDGGVEISSNRVYAAMQHFGGTKAQFPHLWGDIPARPFLGLSAEDERTVLDILDRHLLDAAKA